MTDDPNQAFDGCNWALLVGSFPRGPGMERKELLGRNGQIFVGQGKALAAKAASDVRILVVGNPCNTNCLVAYRNGKEIPAERWSAMTRLDHNRAVAAAARKAAVDRMKRLLASPSGETIRIRNTPISRTPRSTAKPPPK